ncbi:DNRLRE domain-containing protein [Nocardioides dilutus]
MSNGNHNNRLALTSAAATALLAGLLAIPATASAAAVPVAVQDASAQSRGLAAMSGLADSLPLTPMALAAALDEPVPAPELSDARSTSVANPDGTYTTEVSQVPVNFQNSQDDWVPIDADLAPTLRPGYVAENVANDFNVLIPRDVGSSPVRLEDEDGAWLSFQLRGADGSPVITGDSAKVADGPGATKVRFDSETWGVKETIILSAPPVTAPSYVSDLVLSAGLTPELTDTNEIVVRDADGGIRFRVRAPFMEDSSGTPEGFSTAVKYTLSETGSGWRLSMKPDYEWLIDPARVYPVLVDPTTTLVGPNKDTTLNQASPNTSYQTGPILSVGSNAAGKRLRALLKFTLPNTVPIGPTVNVSSASLNVFINSVRTGTATTYAIRRLTSDWGSGATWNNNNAGNTSWNGAGGSYNTSQGPTPTLGSNAAGGKSFTVTDIVNSWVSGASPNYGFIMKAQTEPAPNELGIRSAENVTGLQPILTFTWSSQAPSIVANSLAIPSSYLDGGARYTASLTPEITATAKDADSSSINSKFEVVRLSDSAVVASTASAKTNPSPGSNVGFSYTVPAGVMSYGVGYKARFWVGDETTTGVPWVELPFTTVAPVDYEPAAFVDNFPSTSSQPVGGPDGVDDSDPAKGVADLGPGQDLPVAGTTEVAVGSSWPHTVDPTADLRGATYVKPGSNTTAGANSVGDLMSVTIDPVEAAPEIEGVEDESRFGTPGVLLEIRTAAEAGSGGTGPNDDVDIRVPYADYAHAYGGSWSDRLEVMAYPACFATTPEVVECAEGMVVPSVNDPESQTIAFTAAPALGEQDPVPASPPSGLVADCFPAVAEDDEEWDSGLVDPTLTPEPSGPTSTDGVDDGVPETAVDETDAANTDVDTQEPAEEQAENPPVPAPRELDTEVSDDAACSGFVYSIRASAGGYSSAAGEPGGGSPTATALNPASRWQVGEGSGDFSWSYPFTMPAGMASEAPSLSLNYSSASVDGMTNPESGQVSAVGIGWTMEPGHISRTYASCHKDGKQGSGDLCWRTDNKGLVNELTLVLNGRSTRLIRHGANGEWRLQDDPGWKVEEFSGPTFVEDPDQAPPANADNDSESFKISAPDGTVYVFGSTASAESVWTVPVYGNDSGEPCHDNPGGWCQQGWQWNLDKVIDPNGNRVRYTYATETNYYKRDGRHLTPYIAAGRLTGVFYGYSRSNLVRAGGSQVWLDVDSKLRCTAKLTNVDDPCSKVKKGADKWPDVPNDLICGANATTCTTRSPSFFSRYRYYQIKAMRDTPGEKRRPDHRHLHPDAHHARPGRDR